MSRKDRLIRQWIASGDLPREAIRGGLVPEDELGHRIGSGDSLPGTGAALTEGFGHEIDVAGSPYGTGQPDYGLTRQRPARRTSSALALLAALGVLVWAVLAGAILYMKYQAG